MKFWPKFNAPPEYDNPNPPPEWHDPRLPDFEVIWKIAREHGYAVGLHGSMKRDCDLIAVPWIENPRSTQEFLDALCLHLNASVICSELGKPHGREAYIIQVDGWVKPIDLSITPKLHKKRQTRNQKLMNILTGPL